MPEPLYRALIDSQSKYKDDLVEFFKDNLIGKNEGIDNISVTTLSKAPRQVQLLNRYKHEITHNPMDFYFSLKGSIIHYILEVYSPPHWVKEKRVKMIRSINGERVAIHGQADAYDPDRRTLYDWKFTSGTSVRYDKPEHKMQLNILANLFEKNKMPVDEIKNVYLIERLDARYHNDPNYPTKEYKVVDQDFFATDEVNGFIDSRATLHLEAKDKADKDLPFCTDEERWIRSTEYVVYKRKKGTKKEPIQDWSSKSSFRGFSNKQALDWTKENPQEEEVKIVVQKGSPTACSYCKALPYCNQRQNELRNEMNQQPLGFH